WDDPWWPGPDRIMSLCSLVAGFSSVFLIELVSSFINWLMIGAIFFLLVAWLFISKMISIKVFLFSILIWLNLNNQAGPTLSMWPPAQP
ncbi:cellulose biosynthesis protein BcsG, partial [Escherichia coli]|nr:cellulose biosynthesis protein BcsG [Escherichia coli]